MSKFSKLYSAFDEIEGDIAPQSSSEKFYNNFSNQLIGNTLFFLNFKIKCNKIEEISR